MLPLEQYRDLEPQPRRGRRRKVLTTLQRTTLRVLHERHPDWSLARLRDVIPGLPRNSAAAYLRRVHRVEAKQHRRQWDRLVWRVPGAVWAIDGTWLDWPVPPLGRRALLVVELNSRRTLCLRSVPGERAADVEQLLEELFARHGAPLVLKLDNGSAFVSRRLARFCRRYGVTLLHSPVRQPRWNGACEVSARWAKVRAYAAWRARGGLGALTQADLDAAVTFVGSMPHIDDATRERFLDVVAEQLVIASAQRGLVLARVSRDHVRRSLARVAVRRALQLCHILTIEGRRYHQWLPHHAA
jgi:transposase InsO family protein